MFNPEKVDRSTWRLVHTGRTDIAPGEVFQSPWGEDFRAVTYPVGAERPEVIGGIEITVPIGMVSERDGEGNPIYPDGTVLCQPMWVEESV